MQDINGARRESGKTLIDKLGRNAKIAAVAGKLSVAIQQPTSIIRAAAEINPWYLLRGFKAGKNAAAEMMKYSSLAWWKSNGNYDIGIGKSADEIFWGKTTRGDAVMEKISTSGGLIDPGKVDDWAWTRMWSAVKREISATRKELKPGSDEYFKAVAERFEYICDRTQVVDTVMHRSDMMRSKNDVTKMLTSFQSEPTKSYNMMARAIMNAGRNSGDRAAYGKLARVTTAYAASVAANAAIKAVYEAFRYRDDEEDETLNYIFKGEFAQDWTERFLMNTVSGLNPLENTPIVSTVYEMIPGDRIARYLGAEKYSDYLPSGDLAGHMGLEGISDLISSGADILQYLLDDNSGKRTWYGVWGSFAKSASDAFGLPFSGILANIETLGRIYDPEWLQTKSNMATTSAAFDKLYEAMVSGDKKAALSIRTEFAKGMYGNTPKSPQEIDQGISDKLAINDERILEAWKLRNVDAQYGKLAALYKEIQKDGFTDDMIKRAVNNAQSRYQDEYERLIEDEKPDEAKALLEKCAGYGMQLETEKAPKDLTKELDVSTYEYKDLHRAVRESSISDMAAVYEIMLEESEAEDPEQAVRNSISKEFREEYVGLVKGGKTQEAEELAKRLDVFGFDDEDRLEWVKEDYRENLKKAVEGGEMKEAEKLIETMKDEYEMTDESIASTIKSRFKQDYIDLVIAGKDKEADELAEKLQELGLKYADGNNRFKQANLNKWVLEWEREQEEE